METIKLDLIPGKKMPSLHASQYDDGREHGIDLFENGVVYKLDGTETLTINERKGDDCICSLDIDNTFTDSNHIVFASTEQMCAVWGNNICELVIAKGEKTIGTLNFILEIEQSPTEGGIESESEIKNLERQIDEHIDEVLPEQIAEKVPQAVDDYIGDNYYDKTEVNEALNTKADASATEQALGQLTEAVNGKADANNVYTKQETDNKVTSLIDDANKSTSKTYSSNKIDEIVEKAIGSILPTKNTGKTDVANFTTPLAQPVELVAYFGASSSGINQIKVTHCGKNLVDIRPFNEWETARNDFYVLKNCVPNAVINVSLIDKDTSVNMSGVSLGFVDSKWDFSNPLSTNDYRWFIQNGVVQANKKNTAIADANKILTGLIFYPQNETTYNKIMARYKFEFEKNEAEKYVPYSGTTGEVNLGTTFYNGGVFRQDKDGHRTVTADGETIDLLDGEPLVAFVGENNIYTNVGNVDVAFLYSDLLVENWKEAVGVVETNYYINSNGVKTSYSNVNYCVSSFNVKKGEKYKITAWAGYTSYYFAYYDNQGNFVSGSQSGSGASVKVVDVPTTVPQNAVLLVVAGNTTIDKSATAIKFDGYVCSASLKWLGKKWAVIGDSLTEHNGKTTKNYHDYVAESTGITVVNLGKSGTGYKNGGGSSNPFYSRVADVPTDSDVVTIFGSFNDGLTDLGTETDSGTSTIGGCINTTIDSLYAVMPTVQLGIVSPTPWVGANPYNHPEANDYVELLEKICKRRSIPFLNLYYESNLRPWDSTFRALAYSKDGGNGVHPDETGHALIAPRFEVFLDSLLLD